MAVKLSSRQQAQIAFLDTVPPKVQRVHASIEKMGALQADDAVVRGMIRVLEELKANCQALGMNNLADTAGTMAMMARRGGGLQMKVRGLRELLGSLRINLDGAMRAATTPEPDDQGRPPT